MISSPVITSIVILCHNQVEVTKLCLASLQRHTPVPHQILLVDNGSTDDTPAVLREFAQQGHLGLVELSILRNETNRGFAAGVNQALPRTSGEFIVFLNNDTVLTPGWLEGLLGVAQHVECAGMVGAVSNEVPDPQRVPPTYGPDLQGLDAFATERRLQFARQVIEVERLSGFCLLIPRIVLQTVGMLDERFGLGFFEDDDLGLRVRQAGFKLLVALDTYIHHWGSQTVRSLGLDAQQLLTTNLEKFKDKWGSEAASRYRLSEAPAEPVSTESATVSLCMIVKNEESNLAACLDGIHDLVQEMVIVDTGSTDQTKATAEKYGAKVVDFPWVDSFAAARNIALDHATGDYIFWMDADDRLDAANRDKLRALFAQLRRGQSTGFDMKCICLPDASGTVTVVDHIRLFPRHPNVRWKYRIHEQILPALKSMGGKVRFVDVQIHHVGYQDPALRSRKLDRDLRLLHLENEENPDDPFTLFNLGSVHLELGKFDQAIPYLERSLTRSHPADSIVRKLYALLVQAHKHQNHLQTALAMCKQGREVYPHDVELLFQEGLIRRDLGDLPGAAKALELLLLTKQTDHFASVDLGLRTYRTRHNLAVIYRDMGRVTDAIEVWKTAVQEAPEFNAARLGLAETYLGTMNFSGFDEQMAELLKFPHLELPVQLLQAKRLMATKSFDEARAFLVVLIAKYPEALAPKVILSHVYLQQGIDWKGAEQALLNVLKQDPSHQEASRNLAVLRQQHGTELESGEH